MKRLVIRQSVSRAHRRPAVRRPVEPSGERPGQFDSDRAGLGRPPGEHRRRLVAHVVEQFRRERTLVGDDGAERLAGACVRRSSLAGSRRRSPSSRACARTDRRRRAALNRPAAAMRDGHEASTATCRPSEALSQRPGQLADQRRHHENGRRHIGNRRPIGMGARQERLDRDDHQYRQRERQQQPVGLAASPARQAPTRNDEQAGEQDRPEYAELRAEEFQRLAADGTASRPTWRCRRCARTWRSCSSVPDQVGQRSARRRAPSATHSRGSRSSMRGGPASAIM